MSRKTVDLDAILIASPCSVPWESMTGDAAKRYCGQCRLHVYDFSQMTRKEAEALLTRTHGDICKRIWRRPDGRVLTKACGPVAEALRAVRRRVRVVAAAAAGLLAALGLGGCGGTRAPESGTAATPPPSSPPPPSDAAATEEPAVRDVDKAAGEKPPPGDVTVTAGR